MSSLEMMAIRGLRALYARLKLGIRERERDYKPVPLK